MVLASGNLEYCNRNVTIALCSFLVDLGTGFGAFWIYLSSLHTSLNENQAVNNNMLFILVNCKHLLVTILFIKTNQIYVICLQQL